VPHDWGIVSLGELPAFLILGLLSAAAAWLFVKSTALVHHAFQRLRLPRALRPPVAGLAVGLLAIADPRILGVGYEATSSVLAGPMHLHEMILLAVLKVTATVVDDSAAALTIAGAGQTTSSSPTTWTEGCATELKRHSGVPSTVTEQPTIEPFAVIASASVAGMRSRRSPPLG